MNFILVDDHNRQQLLPFTFTRPVAEIRIGILSIREKWKKMLGCNLSWLTVDYLSKKYPVQISKESDNVLINASVLPNMTLIAAVKSLKPLEALESNGVVLAINCGKDIEKSKNLLLNEMHNRIVFDADFLQVKHVWEIFSKNAEALKNDFELLTAGRKSAAISNTNRCIQAENIFLEEGAKVECAVLNASEGPIYIGKDAEVMEGTLIRGPFALCEHSATKMGAKIYGATTIGPHCKIGGEVSNSVIFGFSNKAHDGFLGNSVIGEWCNLGADTNNSNLKNNYSKVQLYNYASQSFIDTGLQFCGLMMGDHSKCGINTMFNTGTVIGVSANVFGAGFPDKYIPSFTWGGVDSNDTFQLSKAIELAARVFQRRGLVFDQIEQEIMSHLSQHNSL